MSEFDSNTTKLLVHHFQRSGWMPISPDLLRNWISEALTDVLYRDQVPLLPVIEEFKKFIENNGEMYMGFNRMFEGAINAPKTYNELLSLFNKILREAPSYGSIGPPIYMVMAQAMNTSGGFTTFLSVELNKQFKKMFADWAAFLSSSDSRSTLNQNTDGWFSNNAKGEMTKEYPGLSFEQIFECDPGAPYMGFRSWDHFFCRTYRDGIRPVEYPDQPNVVNAACESTVYKLAKDAKDHDTFWLKGEPYSLINMLNNDPDYAETLKGGTVFQGFLSVTGYHRWHSPVTGTIKKIVQLEGTYFVQSPATLGSVVDPGGLPPYLRSLAFVTSITTRTLIFIESSNPLIGLMCFMAIGMTEVSTCEVTVYQGQQVKRGDQLGMFHFGGSSHVLIFRPETKIVFDEKYRNPGGQVPIRAAIAVVLTNPTTLPIPGCSEQGCNCMGFIIGITGTQCAPCGHSRKAHSAGVELSESEQPSE